MTFDILPTKQNQEYNNIESAIVSCWIKSTDTKSSYIQAIYFIEKADWQIKKNIQEPTIVNKDNFIDRELGLKHYTIAEKEKMSFLYLAKSNNIDTIKKVNLKSSYKFNMSNFITKQKEILEEGRCLHHQAGERCNIIIDAHSIQENQVLSEIANGQNKEIYALSKNMSDFKKNDGYIGFRKYPISKFSIFKGFCKLHDNEIFQPIDNSFFESSNKQQIFLYAYRSLAKELFDKENALALSNYMIEDVKENKGLYNQALGLKKGTENALKSLNKHKKIYDNVLKYESFYDIRYVAFNSKDKFFMAFSNIIYPDFDFMGNLLQDLSNTEKNFNLLTFCSVPTKDGWSFIFSWHKSSDNSCLAFIQSLKERMKQGDNLSDLLFKFILLNSENFALSPIWWESLSTDKQKEISKAVTHMMQPTLAIRQYYLYNGLENIAKWNFETIQDNLITLR